MRFEICDRPERRYYKQTKVLRFLNEFIESKFPIARIFEHEYKNVYVAAKSINNSAKKFNLPHIYAFTANGNLYIENRALTEQNE